MVSNMSHVLTTEEVSPVTLNDHWSRLARLILLASMSAVGSVGNVFMISAVMIEDYLRKRGNTFIVNVGLADLLVSGLVIPASAVVILAGLKDNLTVCRFQWFVAVWCFLVTVLSLAAVAWENYFRLCYSVDVYQKLSKRKITCFLLSIWTGCGCISGMQFYSDLSFDYCTRNDLGLIPYQATVCVIFVFFPLSIALVCYIRTGYQVRRYKARPNFKAPVTFNWDYALTQTNMYSFIVFLIFWVPFGVVLAIDNINKVSGKVFYNLAWLAISKSCINSILYGVLNRHFRGAYINLFQYCCCKTTVSFSRRQRPEGVRPSGDVRVHIIPGYNMYCSPQRANEGGRSKRFADRMFGASFSKLKWPIGGVFCYLLSLHKALLGPQDSSYPAAVFCIIATEFCERFSFCGIRTILSLYLRNVLEFSEDSSTVIYHIFIMGCYLVPVVGAIHADSYFGRYRTIRNFSLIYLIGNCLMCVAAVPVLDHNPILLSSIGLLLIAIGTGGLKPCIAAFGAEQFRLPEQRELLRYFFSVFYFTINLGGFVGMVITPILRKNVSCFGDDTCYVLGFGFPAALVLLSILLFILGKNFYKLKTPKKNVILEFLKCSWRALINKRKSKKVKHDHWLDYARSQFDIKLIQDMKIVFSILLLFVPLPIFWSLFDQQGSRWTFQASHMDTTVLGFQIVPDQMQVINPAMVLILIPIFDKVFYPCCEKFHYLRNSLHRMALGGLAAGLAFVSAGILELVLERTYPDVPNKGQGSVNVVNTLPCDIVISNSFSEKHILQTGSLYRFQNVMCINRTWYKVAVRAPKHCQSIQLKNEIFEVETMLEEKQENTFIISYNENHEVEGYMTDPVNFSKSISGNPKIRIDYVKHTNLLENITVSFQSTSGMIDMYFLGEESKNSEVTVSPYIELPQGVYECHIRSERSQHEYEKNFHFAFGGVYSLVVTENKGKIKFVKLFTMSNPNSVNILWQLPQYLFISVAEIMFGVAGLEFSFTQAPKSMKTVTIAGWYLSTAVGNLIVILIIQLNFDSQAYEFFLFGLIIVVDMVIFTEMTSRYHFVDLEVDSSILIMQQETHQDHNT